MEYVVNEKSLGIAFGNLPSQKYKLMLNLNGNTQPRKPSNKPVAKRTRKNNSSNIPGIRVFGIDNDSDNFRADYDSLELID